MKRILLLTCSLLLFASCMTDQKCFDQLKSNGKLPGICAAEFPPVDSVGRIFFLPPVVASDTNVNYRWQIDSLAAQGQALAAIMRYKKLQADSISEQCADVVLSFMNQVDSLERRVRNLQAVYKPPVKDTVKGVQPHYNLNPPALSDCEAKYAISQTALVKALAERDTYHKQFRIALAVAIGLVIIGLLFLFLFLKILK